MPVPANSVAIIELNDGRDLEYAEYGDQQGKPVVFFHGFVGSYHQASPADHVAREEGLRLIAPNRAGVGHSSPHETGTIIERMGDVRQLVKKLHIDDFGVVGVSGGAPYALAAATVFGRRVKVALSISGMGPIADPDLLQRMEPSRRSILSLGKFPLLAQLYLSWRMRGYTENREAFLRTLIKRWPRADQELFQRPELRDMFLGDLENTLMLGQGTRGLAQELHRYFHWGFDLKDVRNTVHLWHGTDDGVVPPTTSAYMAKRLPDAQLSFHPGGHFVIVNIVREVMGRAREAMHT